MLASLPAIMEMIVKGLGIASTVISIGKNAAPVIAAVTALATAAKAGTVTVDDLNATEVILDREIAAFNEDI